MDNIKVSVIVPIYNVSGFIERCAESLFNQTMTGVEYIFVDDATPDDSVDKLREVAKRYPTLDVRIIQHEVNKGLPAARNTGLANARGEYIFHCDSDDYADAEMILEMYGHAVKENADIVWADWYLTMTGSERYMKQPSLSSADTAVRTMLGGGMKFNVWNKLVRRNLYLQYGIRFPEGRAMGEDLTMIKLFVVADKVSYIPRAYYHYVKSNVNAYSRNYNETNLLHLKFNVDELISWLGDKSGDKYDREIEYLKLDVKFPFLFIKDHSQFYKKWKEWYPESNKSIIHNPYISSRSKFIQICASRNQFWLVSLYSLLLNKVLYGMIFK